MNSKETILQEQKQRENVLKVLADTIVFMEKLLAERGQ